MTYRQKVIYTRLNDVLEENESDSKNKSKNINYIQINQKQKLKKKTDSQKNKYINKNLIKSWIDVVQSSKSSNNFKSIYNFLIS